MARSRTSSSVLFPLRHLAGLALLAGGALLGGNAHGAAEGTEGRTPHVSARLVAAADAVAPGERVTVGLAKRITPGWHTYWRNPGDSGLATQVHWQLPAGAAAGPLQWPAPERQALGPVVNYGYAGEVTLLAEFTAPADARPGDVLDIAARAEWLVCSEVCIPEQLDLNLSLPVAETTRTTAHSAITAARARLPQPAPWPARYSRDAHGLQLAVDSGALPAGRGEAWFFPYEWGVIDHAAAQPAQTGSDGLRLTLAPGPLGGDAGPAVLEGVLVIGDGSGATRAYELHAPLGTAASAATPAPPAVGLATALGFALLGGLILNLMPCVFPVLAMKVIALVRHGHGGRDHAARHGLAYLGGVLASFAALAAVVLALQAGGARLGWGFQFQSPLFVLFAAWLLFAVGLNLSGVFMVGGSLAGVGQSLTERGGYAGSFFTGVLAALVATPCTAPFMGVAIGFAMTQPPASLLSVFLALGLGLALPFVVLTLQPALLGRLPKPGLWMLRLKQALAFPMYAAAAWLVWVLALQTGADGLPLALGGMVAIALAAWLHEAARHAAPRIRRTARLGGTALLAATLVAASSLQPAAVPQTHSATAAPASLLPLETYSGTRLAALRAEGRPVFVNFTAAWCITCLVNERVALERPEVAAAFAAREVAYLKGDWTNQDAGITAVLNAHGRSGVPLYLYYPAGAGATPVVLPQLLTADIVLQAIAPPPG
ncbi:protein-disulfide reductase DsbD family protein [Pseudothauera rhizosphaerae]|uniref:Thiol:disulfide interchange protein n=1 Tax=Pseudothauera rhizosphaerae TaxID=2565932 RepID=A0A4S4AJ39_9RHOO|nr:protein-disulfide reductase DsbD domain-containing protein [Pseudothauera rhizosphaerae]THF59397.1 thiol:disulfide interchange protein [Pseudothauera rhizosphaerae]